MCVREYKWFCVCVYVCAHLCVSNVSVTALASSLSTMVYLFFVQMTFPVWQVSIAVSLSLDLTLYIIVEFCLGMYFVWLPGKFHWQSVLALNGNQRVKCWWSLVSVLVNLPNPCHDISIPFCSLSSRGKEFWTQGVQKGTGVLTWFDWNKVAYTYHLFCITDFLNIYLSSTNFRLTRCGWAGRS